MKKSKFSESQIVNILKEAEAGVSVEDLSHQHGFSKASFYKWKARYGGMSISEVKRMKELEEENRRLARDFERIPKVLRGLHFIAFAILTLHVFIKTIAQVL